MPNTKSDDLLDDLRVEIARLDLKIQRSEALTPARKVEISCAIGRLCSELDEVAKVIDGKKEAVSS